MSGILLACVAATSGSGSIADLFLEDQYIYDAVPVPGTAEAGFEITNAGLTNGINSFASYALTPWVTPGSVAASYEVYATLLAGSLTSGTTGSWLSLGTTRAWQLDNTYAGPDVSVATASINVQIRAIGTTTILATGNVALTSSVGIVI